MARQKPPCGSDNGYKWHLRNGQLPDKACLEAHRTACKVQRDKGRCAAGLGWPLLPGKEE
jgi:hypothetical protein